MKRLTLLAALLLATATVWSQDRTPSPAGAELYFIGLKDGAKVRNPLTLHFGLKGMGVAPPGIKFGNTGRRGLVAAANYEVRKYGVHSAMPMREALRRCPQAVCVAPRMRRYQEVSRQVFAILRDFTPVVEGLSLDEAFLDITASQSL